MQIHELNNYNGELNSDAFVAIDNGSDTGKVSVTGLLADTNADISELDTFLNARIDNIIAGGTAPSASEIVDARLGADGVTYASLGDAIRDQVSDLKSDLDEMTTPPINLWNVKWEIGGLKWADGSEEPSTSIVRTDDFIAVEPNTTYAFYDGRDWTKAQYNVGYVAQYMFEYGADGTFLRQGAIYTQQITTGVNTYKIKFRSNAISGININSLNALNFILVKGATYRSYVNPYRKAIFYEKFIGAKSDNLSNRLIFDEYIHETNGVINVNSSALRKSTDWIDVAESEHHTIYYYISKYKLLSPNFNKVICYDENYYYLGCVNGSAIDSNLNYIFKADLLSGTRHIILISGEYSNTTANAEILATLKELAEEKLFVTTNLDLIYADNGINGLNKVDGTLAKHGLLKEIRNENIRPFVLSALDSYVEGIIESGYDATISAMTDIHTKWLEPYAILNFMANSGCVDFAINLGDNIPDRYDTKAVAVDFLRKVFNAQNQFTTKAPIYNAVGNHDVNPVNGSNISDNTNMILTNEFYSLAQERTRNGMLAGKCYGYFDLENPKIRVVILNTSDIFAGDGTPLISGYNTAIQQEQFEWFCNVALDFSDKKDKDEWALLTMAHDRLTVVGNGAFETVIEAFTNGLAETVSASRTVDGHTFILSENVDYTEQGAIEYIGHICGHSHDDAMFTFASNYKEVQIACAVGLAHYYENGTRMDYTRETDTIEAHLFDTICIDRKNHIVYLKRFGVGSDRQFSY